MIFHHAPRKAPTHIPPQTPQQRCTEFKTNSFLAPNITCWTHVTWKMSLWKRNRYRQHTIRHVSMACTTTTCKWTWTAVVKDAHTHVTLYIVTILSWVVIRRDSDQFRWTNLTITTTFKDHEEHSDTYQSRQFRTGCCAVFYGKSLISVKTSIIFFREKNFLYL